MQKRSYKILTCFNKTADWSSDGHTELWRGLHFVGLLSSARIGLKYIVSTETFQGNMVYYIQCTTFWWLLENNNALSRAG